MTRIAAGLAVFAGLLVTVGVALIHVPAGIITAGVLLGAAAIQTLRSPNG